jgi:hypothetical protein
MNEKRSRISQALEESCIGLLMAVLFVAFKYFLGKESFILSEAIITTIFIIVFFFIKGYFWGASSVKFDRQLSEKREEMYGKISELKCYKCFHVINAEENKCPNCGWTWEK